MANGYGLYAPDPTAGTQAFSQGIRTAGQLAGLQQRQQTIDLQRQRQAQAQALQDEETAFYTDFSSQLEQDLPIIDLAARHPRFQKQIIEFSNTQQDLKDTDAVRMTGGLINALDRDDMGAASRWLAEGSEIINSIGPEDFTVEQARQMLTENKDGLRQMALGTYKLAGGKVEDLARQAGDAIKAGTFRTIDTGTGIEVIDTRTGESSRTIPKTKEKRFVQTLKTADGYSKVFSDGSIEPISPEESVKTPDMEKGLSLNRANEIIDDSNEGQRKDAGFALRVNDNLETMDHLTNPDNPNRISADRAALISRALGEGTLANYQLSPEEQTYLINARDSLMAILRRESGAVIGEEELKNYSRQYLPQPGDSEKTMKAKRRLLQNQFDAIRGGSGRVYDALRVSLGKGEGPDKKWLNQVLSPDAVQRPPAPRTFEEEIASPTTVPGQVPGQITLSPEDQDLVNEYLRQ